MNESAGSVIGDGNNLSRRPVRLAYLVSHPIQYQAPLLREIAQDRTIDLTVWFGSDFSVRGYRDEGFGVEVKWDVPLLEGYRYRFLPSLRDNGTAGVFSPVSRGFMRLLKGDAVEPGFDVLWIHGYSTLNSIKAMVAAKMLGIPVLLRADSWLGDRPRSRLTRIAKAVYLRSVRHLVCAVLVIGTHNRRYWQHYFGMAFPAFLMPYSVNNGYFQRLSAAAANGREALREELDLAPDRPVILFASKLQPRKQCDDLIAAYASLATDPGSDPLPYLVVVGDGEQRAALEQQAAATGFKSIRFCGFRNQSELPRYLDLCSVFVLPSRHEPWGLIVNEAMNAARAVIVSDDVGAQIDLITDGVEGCVYPVRDVAALADAMRRVLTSPGTAEKMGQLALERINSWNFEADVRGLNFALCHAMQSRGQRHNDQHDSLWDRQH